MLNKGKVDIIEGSFCKFGMYILLNDGSNFVNSDGISFLNYVLDYNNDGKLDIGAGKEIMINKGSNNTLNYDKISIDQGDYVNFSTLMDYDNDGKVDVLLILLIKPLMHHHDLSKTIVQTRM